MTLPVIENPTLVQRDTAQTFLVDVSCAVFQSASDDVTAFTVEFAQDVAGPFTPAQAQASDFRHTASTPISSIPAATPGKEINYVWKAFFDLPEGLFTDIFVRITVTADETAQVVVGPFVVDTRPVQSETPFDLQLARRSSLSRTPFDFLGNGIVVPFRRGSRDIVSARGVELVRSSVRQILGTRATIGRLVGELPWRTDFGAKVWALKHRQNSPTLHGQAEAFVREALRWEPRVEVIGVFTEKEPFAGPNELRVRVRYRVIDENTDDNEVILPEFEEEIVIGSAV